MLKLLTSFYMHNFVHPIHFLKLVVSKTSIVAAIICWLVPLLSVFHALAVVGHLHYLNPQFYGKPLNVSRHMYVRTRLPICRYVR